MCDIAKIFKAIFSKPRHLAVIAVTVMLVVVYVVTLTGLYSLDVTMYVLSFITLISIIYTDYIITKEEQEEDENA